MYISAWDVFARRCVCVYVLAKHHQLTRMLTTEQCSSVFRPLLAYNLTMPVIYFRVWASEVCFCRFPSFLLALVLIPGRRHSPDITSLSQAVVEMEMEMKNAWTNGEGRRTSYLQNLGPGLNNHIFTSFSETLFIDGLQPFMQGTQIRTPASRAVRRETEGATI